MLAVSNYQYSLPSVKELTTRAVAMSLESNIVYCNLTLRPVGVNNNSAATKEDKDGTSRKLSTCDVEKFVMGDRTVKYVRHKSVPYLQVCCLPPLSTKLLHQQICALYLRLSLILLSFIVCTVGD